FDTGSPRTILSLRAAKWAGITPDSPGVIPAGLTSGVGKNAIRVWIAPIDKFEVGGEMIEHTRVLMGDIDLGGLDVDMLLGTDFFLAHHIYVAYSQDRLYFTYNGGVVFDLNARRSAPAAGAQSAAQSDRPTATPGQQALPAGASDLPTDAAGFMRRGMADASRGEYPQAIADLTRACDLDRANADCRYQRGLAYWHSVQRASALADFNAAIQLQPGDFAAHMARAELELRGQPAGTAADLDAVDRLAPQEADLRLPLARLYGAAAEYAGAIHQYDLWIDYHPNDLRVPSALAGRCGSEAIANVDVDRALEDCNQALRSIPKPASAVAVSNRGLVYLRQGKLDSALSDFETALKLQPKLFIARYGLGLVELKKGLKDQGQNDLLAIQVARPELARRLAAAGLKP
ncbi:MAG: tetratricopeptide repeat protein, partial [Steroidobacteraceae bacterium]